MEFREVSRLLLLTIMLVSVLSGCVSPVLMTPTSPTATATVPSIPPTVTPALPEKGILRFGEIASPGLASNLVGDSDTRRFIAYLPPSYASSNKHYPVVYVLHYYTGTEWSLVGPVQSALDDLIANNAAEEMILVFPDASNKFKGSWYLNSPTIGDYETYITHDLVDFIDTNYRTIPHRDSRGVTGCSMGGNGAIHLGFKYPDIFGVAAPVSGAYNFEQRQLWDKAAQLLTDIPTDFSDFNEVPFPAQNLMSIVAAAAPAVDNPPFYMEMPFEIVADQVQAVADVREKVNALDAVHEVYDYLEQANPLRALLIYHGAEDDIAPAETVREFDAMLTELGVTHEYLEVDGGHCDLDYKPVVQFMSENLVFEESMTQLPLSESDIITVSSTLTITEPITMELIFLPASQFLMGSDPDVDTYASKDDQPQHVIELPGFYIGKHEVTNQQYAAFTDATDHRTPRHWNDGNVPLGKEDHPVVWITWNDAVQFTKWLIHQTGADFRLPSEAEWEKACRGTDGGIYPWGNSKPDSERANYDGNIGATTEVGSFSPQGDSPYGVADMAGNVWEWTSSLFADLPYTVDGREEMEANGRRVMRGGAFYWGNDDSVRCAERDGAWMTAPTFQDNDVGIRIVLHP